MTIPSLPRALQVKVFLLVFGLSHDSMLEEAQGGKKQLQLNHGHRALPLYWDPIRKGATAQETPCLT